MQKKENPKKPSDYRTLRVRVPPEMEKDVEALLKTVERVRTQKNRHRSETEKVWKINHVIIEALEVGLREMSKEK